MLAGDFNVIPEPEDAAHPEQWTGDALFLPRDAARPTAHFWRWG